MNLSFYGITERSYLKNLSLTQAVEIAIKNGVKVIQVREKHLNSRDFYKQVKNVKKVTDKYFVPLIINDRVDIALAVEADGVHVGQEDIPASIVRKIIGKEKKLGVSVETVEEAKEAQKAGADYLGVGPVFPSPTKPEVKTIDMNTVGRIKENVKVPVIAIGGITPENVFDLIIKTKVDGVAIISALYAGNIEENAKKISKEIERAKNYLQRS
jgi:thiamine-phosphate pyrophosphorylase